MVFFLSPSRPPKGEHTKTNPAFTQWSVTSSDRYAGQPSGYYSNPFKDVGATSEASYYNAILWAVGKGITTGTSATTFSPYASCNRAEAVTFLYRYTNGL